MLRNNFLKNMNLKFDVLLNIAVGSNILAPIWTNKSIYWSKLATKLSEPVFTSEKYKDYILLSKKEQCNIKDIGGFVGGELKNGKRNKANVLSRQLLTLDLDNSHENLWNDFIMLYDCAALIHSTHKSCPEKPRHRLIIPLSRKVTPSEYQAVMRKIAEDINIDTVDASTFDVNRLMFWPSVSSDMQYYFEYQDGEILNPDSILKLYKDWKNPNEWATPFIDTGLAENSDILKKQEDPLNKKGLIGIFCRTYNIHEAITKFLSDEYEFVNTNRYTYKKGTTVGGLIVYENKFAYSHHGTDPTTGILCNAYDLVRVHKFGHLDSGHETKESDKKSHKAMEKLMLNDPLIKTNIAKEKYEEAKNDFKIAIDTNIENEKWLKELEINTKGEYINSSVNLNLIFKNDPILKNAFIYNLFDNKKYIAHSLLWRDIKGIELMKDVDYSGVRNYIECVYGIVAKQKVEDALALEFERNKYHPIINYIKTLKWDGVSRVNTLLIDYFGCCDNSYTRAIIRKILCGAIARIFNPGTKFDMMLIIVGKQGTYKSTFVKKLGKNWFSDTFITVQGKEAYEQLQGAWIIEIAELSGLKKAEIESIKHYVSKCEDSFRPAYGHVVETYKRQCIFIGTTNNKNFLRDPTGNRRFMPVDVREQYIKKSVITDLTDEETDQIWAEAYQLYLKGESLYLSEEESAIAVDEQVQHEETDERKGVIEKYLGLQFPSNWDDMDLLNRRQWLFNSQDIFDSNTYTLQKNIVCTAEIWCECLGKDKADMSRYNTREINDIMKSLPDWEISPTTKIFPLYGKQKYYIRKNINNDIEDLF